MRIPSNVPRLINILMSFSTYYFNRTWYLIPIVSFGIILYVMKHIVLSMFEITRLNWMDS